MDFVSGDFLLIEGADSVGEGEFFVMGEGGGDG